MFTVTSHVKCCYMTKEIGLLEALTIAMLKRSAGHEHITDIHYCNLRAFMLYSIAS